MDKHKLICDCCGNWEKFKAIPHPWEFIELQFEHTEIESIEEVFKWFSDHIDAASIRCGQCGVFQHYVIK